MLKLNLNFWWFDPQLCCENLCVRNPNPRVFPLSQAQTIDALFISAGCHSAIPKAARSDGSDGLQGDERWLIWRMRNWRYWSRGGRSSVEITRGLKMCRARLRMGGTLTKAGRPKLWKDASTPDSNSLGPPLPPLTSAKYLDSYITPTSSSKPGCQLPVFSGIVRLQVPCPPFPSSSYLTTIQTDLLFWSCSIHPTTWLCIPGLFSSADRQNWST